MRQPVMLLASDGRHEGVTLRLYGPDASGALDASAPVQTGRGPTVQAVTRPQEWLEQEWPGPLWLGGPRPAGWLDSGWLDAAWLAAERPVGLLGAPQEWLAGAYGAQAIDDVGNTSGAPASGSALVIGRPPRLSQASVAVSGGVVTATVAEQLE